jgi:hypothetical protein
MADDSKNSVNAWALLLVPIIVAALIRKIIPAIDTLLVENWQIAVYYGLALLMGFFLFRRSRTEKDHEFHRVKNIKKLRKAYVAEDRGLWSKADSAMAQLERDAEGYEASDKDLVKGQEVMDVLRTKRTDELDADAPKEDVRSLLDEDHVRKSAARLSGDADSMPKLSGAAVEMMKSRSSGQTNVDDMLAELAAEDKRVGGGKQKAAPKPKEQAQPKPQPKPKPKPEVGGGQMGEAGISHEDKLFDDLGASIGGGKSVGKETKICLDCGGRNPMGKSNCHNCGSSLT